MNVGSPDGPTVCAVCNKCVHIDQFVPAFIQTLSNEGNGLAAAWDPTIPEATPPLVRLTE